MNTNTIQLPAQLYETIRQKAAVVHKTPDMLVTEWLTSQVEFDNDTHAEALEREMTAFEQQKPVLLTQYPGQFVAMYQGNVVAVGESRLELVKEVYRRFGEVVCYVEKVTTEPPRRVRVPSLWKAK